MAIQTIFNGAPFGTQNVQALGTGVSDIFAGIAENAQIAGVEAEQQNYEAAAALARKNAQYTKMSTAITQAQENRQLILAQGKTQGEVAGGGFALSGSALDIMRSNAQQGALQQAVTGYQGQITEAGYNEQAQAYTNLAKAANSAIQGEKLSQIGSYVGAGISALAAIV